MCVVCVEPLPVQAVLVRDWEEGLEDGEGGLANPRIPAHLRARAMSVGGREPQVKAASSAPDMGPRLTHTPQTPVLQAPCAMMTSLPTLRVAGNLF